MWTVGLPRRWLRGVRIFKFEALTPVREGRRLYIASCEYRKNNFFATEFTRIDTDRTEG